jgi:hypothetical protein
MNSRQGERTAGTFVCVLLALMALWTQANARERRRARPRTAPQAPKERWACISPKSGTTKMQSFLYGEAGFLVADNSAV